MVTSIHVSWSFLNYLGQTQVPQTKLQSFLELAKELKMKGIHNEDAGKTIENTKVKEAQALEPNAINYEVAWKERNMMDQPKGKEDEKNLNIKLPALSLSCDYCPFTTKRYKTALTEHIQKEHEGVRYPCDHCTHQAKNKQNLRDHKASVHKIDPIFRCMLCDYCTNHSTAWKNHAKHRHPKFKAQEICKETLEKHARHARQIFTEINE